MGISIGLNNNNIIKRFFFFFFSRLQKKYSLFWIRITRPFREEQAFPESVKKIIIIIIVNLHAVSKSVVTFVLVLLFFFFKLFFFKDEMKFSTENTHSEVDGFFFMFSFILFFWK